MKLGFLLICMLVSSIAYSQKISRSEYEERLRDLRDCNSIPILSKSQMYSDFDYLIEIIESFNPQIHFRDSITGGDMISEMEDLRKEIVKVQCMEDFILLINKVLGHVLDRHCRHAGNLYFYRNSVYKKDIKRYGLGENVFGINLNYSSLINTSRKVLCEVLYRDGDYFTLHPISIQSNGETCTIPGGTQIVSINGVKLSEYVKSTKEIQDLIRWDFERQTYFVHGTLYQPKEMKVRSFKYSTNNEKEIISNEGNGLTIQNGECSATKKINPQVLYLKSDSILYIRLPYMSVELLQEYKRELRYFRGHELKSVVIDVRGNEGGNDNTWMELLKHIIDKPVEKRMKLAVNKNDQVKSSFERRRQKTIYVEQVPYLNNSEYYVAYDESELIKPKMGSLRFNGEVIVMVDENIFSSTGAFASTASRNNKIRTIGMRTNYLMGQGLSPDLFVLPESKFCFFMEKYIDITDLTDLESVYNDKPEVSISVPISYYMRKACNDVDFSTEESLVNEDEFFKKVLTYIRSSNE